MSDFEIAGDEESIIQRIIMELSDLFPEKGFYRLSLGHLTTRDTGKVDIEIRSRFPFFGLQDTPKVIHQIRLDNSGDFPAILSSNVRRKISRAEKNGVVVKKGGQELVPDFTRVYNRNIQRIGSPTLGKKFFLTMADQADLIAEVFVAYLEGKAIGGSFSVWYDHYYENLWFATLRDYNKLYTSYLLHAEMIKSALKHHSTIYSLGRSTKGSGVYHYKRQWPVKEIPIYFSRSVTTGISLKQQKWLTVLWKFVPPPVADAVGPFFARKMY
ncbi:MAG: GNAT family N-acetyltransferase [bacterium]